MNEPGEEYDVFSGGLYTTPTTISSSKFKYTEAIISHKTNTFSCYKLNLIQNFSFACNGYTPPNFLLQPFPYFSFSLHSRYIEEIEVI